MPEANARTLNLLEPVYMFGCFLFFFLSFPFVLFCFSNLFKSHCSQSEAPGFLPSKSVPRLGARLSLCAGQAL